MSDKIEKINVDEMGIRLAPSPMKGGEINRLPSVRQDFVLRPSLEIDEPLPEQSTGDISTADDYQPKRKDIDRLWKRKKRTKNAVCGLIMFLFSAAVLLPYIFAATSVKLNLPLNVVPVQYNVIKNLIDAATLTVAKGWLDAEVSLCWKQMLPSIILLFGLVFVLVNLIKSLLGLFCAVRVQRYLISAIVYLMCIAGLLIATVVGAEDFGIAKVGFVETYINGWNTSELIGLAAVAAANILGAAVCSVLNPDKSGYIK